MFTDVRGCSLRVVGVPVKLHRMTRWEDFNLRQRFLSPIKDFLKRGAAKRLHLEQLPGYAPELNPDEGIWY